MVKPNVNRKRLMICIEAVSYDYLRSVPTPNIDSLDPHPAISMGCTTRATVPALLGGFLPSCELGNNCPKNHLEMLRRWTYPYFLTTYHQSGRLWLYAVNGWVAEYVTPFLNPIIRKLVIEHYAIADRRGEFKMMRDHFLSCDPDSLPGYFAYFHVMETHPPYYPYGEVPDNPKEKKRIALQQVDRDLKPLLNLDVDELVITSDHEENYLGRRVFLATRVRE